MTTLNKEYYIDTLSPSQAPLLDLPERVLQFGTGVLLRGLCDYVIDKANKHGEFNGRIVVVKSTNSDSSDFDKQDCLYTLFERGIDKGQLLENQIVISALSRVINAATEWDNILKLAANPDMQIIISNTTEVGLQYVAEDIFMLPPQSFPAKLTAFLYERYRHFEGSMDSGMTIIPTELIVDNGKLLRGYVLQHAEANDLPPDFINWVNTACDFCSSLVDRIVPGALSDADSAVMPYNDKLAIQAEPYLLWAIEGSERVKERLSFSKTDTRTIIAEDITQYREQKLRILNGGHTISVPLAYLSGERLVVNMMKHPILGQFVEKVIETEIVPTLYGICEDAHGFANDVINRFKNPFIEHKLISITLQCTSKMQSRNSYTFKRYYERHDRLPPLMCLGFAAYLRFTKPVKVENKQYFGLDTEGEHYLINDDKAAIFYEYWSNTKTNNRESIEDFVEKVISDERLFDETLRKLPDFVPTIAFLLYDIFEFGPLKTLEKMADLQAISA
jgi:tagaturonate reductase